MAQRKFGRRHPDWLHLTLAGNSSRYRKKHIVSLRTIWIRYAQQNKEKKMSDMKGQILYMYVDHLLPCVKAKVRSSCRGIYDVDLIGDNGEVFASGKVSEKILVPVGKTMPGFCIQKE